MAKHNKNPDSVSWTCGTVASNACPMSGSDGRYMSTDIGPTAVSRARRAVSARVSRRSMRLVRSSRGRFPPAARNAVRATCGVDLGRDQLIQLAGAVVGAAVAVVEHAVAVQVGAVDFE